MAGSAVIGRLGCGVAGHAEFHVVGDFPGEHIAFAHWSVTLVACGACGGVHPVAEVDECGKLIHPNPGKRRLGGCGCRELLDMRTLTLDGLVTRQAEGLGRKAHRFSRIRIAMARLTLQAKSKVGFVTVRNGLLLPQECSGEQQQSGTRAADCLHSYFGVT